MKSALKSSLILLVPLFATLAGCGEKAAEKPAVQAAAPEVAAVRFADLAQYPERDAPASALGRNEARIAAEVSARVLAIAADSGDAVKAGQVLVRLDPRDAELALARAEAALMQTEARLKQAEPQIQRARSLREKNFISAEALTLRETELVAAQADVQAARANRDSARRGVEKCTVVAPFAGIVRTRTAQVGELAAPGTLLLSLAETADLQLVAQVQARDAEGLGALTTTAVEFRAAGRTYALKPLRISGAVSREARTVEARFAFATAAPAPGTEGQLVWRDPRPHLAADYILRRNGEQGVFVLDQGKARFQPLPGAQEGRPASADFAADTPVVTRGRHALQDGMAVTVAVAK
jgi:RND family efflux transporter MFP subunit